MLIGQVKYQFILLLLLFLLLCDVYMMWKPPYILSKRHIVMRTLLYDLQLFKSSLPCFVIFYFNIYLDLCHTAPLLYLMKYIYIYLNFNISVNKFDSAFITLYTSVNKFTAIAQFCVTC